jgi:hypothetical protein
VSQGFVTTCVQKIDRRAIAIVDFSNRPLLLKGKNVTELMEPIETRTDIYVAMSTHGLFVWNLRGKYITDYLWNIQAEITGYMTPEQAKAKLKDWLERQYKATDVTFFKRTSDKDTVFRASFKRGDL